jgi:hypothetical protein
VIFLRTQEGVQGEPGVGRLEAWAFSGVCRSLVTVAYVWMPSWNPRLDIRCGIRVGRHSVRREVSRFPHRPEEDSTLER